jgi:two-component system repressor protein LuxO
MKINPQSIILLAEDDLITAATYKTFLRDEPISLIHLETGKAILAYLKKMVPNIILLDLGLPDMNGIDILKYVHKQQLKCVVIFITMEHTVDVVVEAMRYGSFDFIEKPCQANRLLVTLRNALNQHHLSQRVKFYEETFKRQQYHDFLGASKPMQTIYQIIDNVANSKVSILITGESGTGKELCAEAIHKESKRVDKPFVVCNCAAIPENLRESSLFGHVKGAFTGAINEHKGLVSEADGGTLFLDEIGELPHLTQATLLRFVQTKTFSKMGSNKLERVDVRFVCATNRDLLAEVKAGRFREDLYYRINVIEMRLPALRTREQDILLLANYFLHKFAKEEQKKFRGFNREAEKKLLGYKWPGNVRQLQNTIQKLVVLNRGTVITAEMITIQNGGGIDNNSASSLGATDSTITPKGVVTINKFCSFEEIEKEAILKTIENCNGNVFKAAKLLGLGRTTIHRRQQKWKSIK